MTQDWNSDAKSAFDAAPHDAFAQPSFDELDDFGSLSKPFLESLWRAVLHPNRMVSSEVVREARDQGVTPSDFADRYIPMIASQLGDRWCEDQLGFAQVTIGTARLQAMLRFLGPEWSADQTVEADGPLILLVSPPNDQHTLGSILLAGQLRRRGYSVRLALHPTRDILATTLRHVSFDAIFISASESESLEKLRKLVDFLKISSGSSIPIVVGGGILRKRTNVASMLGIEFATANIDEAIEKCGLTQRQTTNAISGQKA